MLINFKLNILLISFLSIEISYTQNHDSTFSDYSSSFYNDIETRYSFYFMKRNDYNDWIKIKDELKNAKYTNTIFGILDSIINNKKTKYENIDSLIYFGEIDSDNYYKQSTKDQIQFVRKYLKKIKKKKRLNKKNIIYLERIIFEFLIVKNKKTDYQKPLQCSFSWILSHYLKFDLRYSNEDKIKDILFIKWHINSKSHDKGFGYINYYCEYFLSNYENTLTFLNQIDCKRYFQLMSRENFDYYDKFINNCNNDTFLVFKNLIGFIVYNDLVVFADEARP